MKAPNVQVGNASGTELKFFNMWSILELQSEFKARAHALRLDLNHRPQLLPETGRTSSKSTVATGSSSASSVLAGEDYAELSGTQAQVQALAAKAAQLPEVGQERVHALRQTIESGLYHPGPEHVAGAMFEHMIAGPAA